MKTSSRRQFMTTTGAAAFGAALPASAQLHEKTEGSWIDSHVHVWDADRENYPISPDFADKDIAPATFTPDELRSHQKGTKVGRTVLIQMSFLQYDNSYMTDVIAQSPDEFRGVAIVDESKENLESTMVGLKEKGVSGFRLYAFLKNVKTWEDSLSIHQMWRIGATERLAMCCLTDPDSLPIIQKLCEKHPDTPVVVDHFARIGMKGSIDQGHLDNLLALAKFKNTYVKTSAFYALGAKKPPHTELGPMVEQLRDTFGSDRLMWGSDCPYQVQGENNYADSVALIEEKLDFLSSEEKLDIMENTAAKVFFS